MKLKVLSGLAAILMAFGVGNYGVLAATIHKPIMGDMLSACLHISINLDICLFLSIDLGIFEMVERDLAEGANIHSLDTRMGTPLHHAIRCVFDDRYRERSLDILDLLLRRGADPDLRVGLGDGSYLQTPYDYFELNYSNFDNQDLVLAVRERLNSYRSVKFEPEAKRRRVPQ